jgi:pimeloyl-ACP methyl ester carboxylesterase
MCRRFLPVVLAVLLGGCASFDRDGTANGIAQQAQMTRAQAQAGAFVLTTFRRQRDPRAPLNVYIEGDGLAWRSRTEVSPDPTPTNPLGLRLAALDPSENVLYVARPCQYTPMETDRRCNEVYWTDKRFAEEVVASVNQAIDQALRSSGSGVRLVGYSGGGAVAALLAARRSDVIDLRTVAGNLDHVTLNRHHDVTPQRGSLNAADVASRLARLPQLHLIGERDSVVVPVVAESYLRRTGATGCVTLRRIAGATHAEGWTDVWPRIVRERVACTGGGMG